MHGNVREWTLGIRTFSYPGGELVDPIVIKVDSSTSSAPDFRAQRGGECQQFCRFREICKPRGTAAKCHPSMWSV